MRLFDGGGDVARLALIAGRGAAREVLDLVDERGQPPLRRDDDVGEAGHLRIDDAIADRLGVADERELVADLVRQPGGDAADRGQPLGAHQLVVRALELVEARL